LPTLLSGGKLVLWIKKIAKLIPEKFDIKKNK